MGEGVGHEFRLSLRVRSIRSCEYARASMTEIDRAIWRRLCARSATARVMYAYMTGKYYLGDTCPVWVI